MRSGSSIRSILPRVLLIAGALIFLPPGLAFAQHSGAGGTGTAGGAHAGGGGHAAPATGVHAPVSRPASSPGAARTGGIPGPVPPSPGRVAPPAGLPRPFTGATPRPGTTIPSPGIIIGYPTRRPIHPIHPIVPVVPHPHNPVVAEPFFPFGFGFNPFFWPGCPVVWGWGYGGCASALGYNNLAYDNYDYGIALFEPPAYSPGSVAGQYETPIAPPYYIEGGSQFFELYLKDGTVYRVTDYWLVNDKLHFTTVEDNGTRVVEHVIDFDQLDVPRTVNINTQRGFRFVLRDEPIDLYLRDHPELGAPAPSAAPEAPAAAPPAQVQPQP